MNTSALAERSAATSTQTRQRQAADPEFERLLQKPTALRRVTRMLAERLGLPDDTDEELIETLKATAFRQRESGAVPITDAQMLALLIIANEYGLNPWTKEIYAFPDRGGIQPIVGYDGWVRIINEHPQFDGMEFEVEPTKGEFATCRIFRKDRSRPIEITEYLAECKRNTDPWSKWPRRMIRNKSVIQCARLAFGFALQDDEEGAIAAGIIPAVDDDGVITTGAPAPGPRRRSAASAPPAAAPTESAGDAAAAPPPPPAAEPSADAAAPKPATTGDSVLTTGQVAYLRNKIKAAGLQEETFHERFNVSAIEALTSEQFDTVKAELLAMA